MVPTPSVDLSQVGHAEIILRGGNLHDPRAQQETQKQYARPNRFYADLSVGLSCLFRPGASVDDLAIEGNYPNPSLSVTTISRLTAELATIRCSIRLYGTPVARYPGHHTLVFFRNDVLETTSLLKICVTCRPLASPPVGPLVCAGLAGDRYPVTARHDRCVRRPPRASWARVPPSRTSVGTRARSAADRPPVHGRRPAHPGRWCARPTPCRRSPGRP